MSKQWVALVAVGMTVSGCSKYIKVDRRVSEREVRRYEEAPNVDDSWSYDGNVMASPGTGDITVKIEAVRFKNCSTKVHRVVRKTEVTDKRWEDPGTRGAFHWSAVFFVGVLGSGLLSRYGFDNPFTTVEFTPSGDKDKPTITGWATIIGGAGVTFLLPIAIGTDFLTIDGSKDLGESDEVTPSTTRCQLGAAAGAKIKIAGIEATANDAGIFEATITDADLARTTGDALIEVEGHAVSSPSLVERRDQVAKQRAKDQQRAAETERVAAIGRASDAEVAAGACSADRKDELPRILGTIQQSLEQSLGFVVLDHVTTLATPAGTRLPFTFATAGEYHVFAFSYSPLSFKGGIEDSPFGPGFEGMTGARVSSTIVQASRSSPPAISLTGKGCTLVVQAKKL